MIKTPLQLLEEKQTLIKQLGELEDWVIKEKDWVKGLLDWIEKRPMYDRRELLYDSNEQIEIYNKEILKVIAKIKELDREIYAGKELEEIENNERGNW